MTDDEKVAEYVRRIAPIREQFDLDQERLEADARFRAGLLVTAASQRFNCGRYWALGPALAAMEVQPDVDKIEAQMQNDIAALSERYQAASRALQKEIGL